MSRTGWAVTFYGLVTLVSLTIAALTWDPSDWGPAELIVALAGFGVASELLPIELRPRSHPLGGWYFTSTAPFVLAAVWLGPAPAVAIALFGLAVSMAVERPPWPHALTNVANYSLFSVVGALAAQAAIRGFEIGPADASLALLVVAIYALDLAINFLMTVGYDAIVDFEPLRGPATSRWRLQIAAEAPIVLMTALTVHLYGTSGLGALVVLAAVQLMFIHVARELQRSTERATRISELSASRGKLVGQILDAEEGERRRLAEALHDDAMQNLLAARQDLAEAPSGPSVQRTRRALDASIDQLRDAIFTLHPTVLEHAGLAAAVESVAQAHARRAGFDVVVEVEPAQSCERDPLTFTVCRELLGNAAEHSGAANVAVRVAQSSANVTIEVADDGRGFPARSLEAALQLGHIGLASISERIDALGGSFEVESEPGTGTRVVATLPVDGDTARSVAAPIRSPAPVPGPAGVVALPAPGPR
jgi:two-component system NarL family sensor kinase